MPSSAIVLCEQAQLNCGLGWPVARHRLRDWRLSRHRIGIGIVKSTASATTGDPNAGANGAGTDAGAATHLRAACCTFSDIWAGRTGGGRTAEIRLCAFFRAATAVLNSPGVGAHPKAAAPDWQWRTTHVPSPNGLGFKPGARRSE